jgi:hypothetical protein
LAWQGFKLDPWRKVAGQKYESGSKNLNSEILRICSGFKSVTKQQKAAIRSKQCNTHLVAADKAPLCFAAKRA